MAVTPGTRAALFVGSDLEPRLTEYGAQVETAMLRFANLSVPDRLKRIKQAVLSNEQYRLKSGGGIGGHPGDFPFDYLDQVGTGALGLPLCHESDLALLRFGVRSHRIMRRIGVSTFEGDDRGGLDLVMATSTPKNAFLGVVGGNPFYKATLGRFAGLTAISKNWLVIRLLQDRGAFERIFLAEFGFANDENDIISGISKYYPDIQFVSEQVALGDAAACLFVAGTELSAA